ncbi:MAG: folate-binding protein [Rhodovarius sp.]|nr:folate-binding protein [Rhodovarius sp.]MCX7931622.1 folate-binding protein [Rhodovarius sp.]
MPVSILPDRAVIELAGEDRITFLQGLVSNDVRQAGPGRAVFAAFLTPQGRWLADFFIHATPDALLLDCEAGHVPLLVQRLSRLRLRARIRLSETGRAVLVGWGDAAPIPGAVPDPRLAEAGWRAIGAPGDAPDLSEAYDLHRLALGLPDGSRDLRAEQTLLLEAGYDELHAISWDKGCYLGQELTARTRYRGLIKRRLMPVRVEGPLPAPDTAVLLDGAEVGEMRSGRSGLGIAMLRLSALAASRPLACGQALLHPAPAPWMRLPALSDAG